MREEIIEKILAIPLSEWTGHYTTTLNGLRIDLVRGNPGGSPTFWFDIGGTVLGDKRASALYYSLYEKDKIVADDAYLTSIYNTLCK